MRTGSELMFPQGGGNGTARRRSISARISSQSRLRSTARRDSERDAEHRLRGLGRHPEQQRPSRCRHIQAA